MQSRSNMLEHHRSAAWSEREYLNMYNLVAEKQAEFQRLFDVLDDNLNKEHTEDTRKAESEKLSMELQREREKFATLKGLLETKQGADIPPMMKQLEDTIQEIANTETALWDLMKTMDEEHAKRIEKLSLTCDYVRLLSENRQDREVQRALYEVQTGRSTIPPGMFRDFIDGLSEDKGSKRKKPDNPPAG